MRTDLLPHLLTAAADRRSHRVAVVDGRDQLTYGELEARANRLAHLLRATGVSRHDRVGLFLPKSVSAIVGVYGIMKAGAAYVPLDPAAPASRLAYIIKNCGIRWLVSGREKAETWNVLLDEGVGIDAFIVLDADQGELDAPAPTSGQLVTRDALGAMPATAPSTNTIDLDLAYILYTSGSTGQPKGVMLSHLNALSFVRWGNRYFAPGIEDVFSNHAPLHFDLSILDLFVAAMAGARLVLVPPEISVFPVEIARFIELHGITIWYSVPSILSLLTVHGRLTPGRLSSLRHVIFAGEVFPTKYLRSLMTLLPETQFTNLYGPTETNVCTYYPVPPLADDQVQPIPIGRAIDNVEVYAMTEDGRVAGVGETGELFVRGTTVAYGYWGDPQRTSRGFGTNPTGPATDRIYRTGDMVRLTPDGDYLLLGRRDHQIKSRGYRIELGDVETALYAHPGVAEVVVVPVPDDIVGNRLRACVVRRDRVLTDGDLARFCATLLPRYMVPEQFEFLDALPKTSTGKVDRTALGAAVARA